MLSSFLYYLIRSRSSYSGQTHTPVVRVAITLVVMLSWLGGMALLLMFAPINADRVITAKHFHSYLVSFTCLFVLVIFIAIKGAYERSKKNSVDDKQMAQSIAEALRRFAAPDAEAGTGGALGGLPQAQPRPYTAQRPRAGMRDPAAAPSHGGITLTYAELRNLALDAKVINEGARVACTPASAFNPVLVCPFAGDSSARTVDVRQPLCWTRGVSIPAFRPHHRVRDRHRDCYPPRAH